MPKKKSPKVPHPTPPKRVQLHSRRAFVKGMGAAAAVTAVAPTLWIPRVARADSFNTIKHLVYVRLNGGFRFTAAYNGDVASEFNPYGLASGVASGVQWGPSALLESSPWLSGDAATVQARTDLGMSTMPQIANSMAVVPCVDHEPLSGGADGNHGTGLERYYTGYAGGGTSFLTMINYALRDRVATGSNVSSDALPAFSLGSSGMALGAGIYAAYRPAVIEGTNFSRFRTSASSGLPDWATQFAGATDARMRDRQHTTHQPTVDNYIQSRAASARFDAIFGDPILNIDDTSETPIDGLTQSQLQTLLGNSGAGRRARLALRLFHFGCPAVYFGEGGYDMHSNEENNLPSSMEGPNQLLCGLNAALRAMAHPDGGTYWDHTLVVLGSEFGRTGRGNRFNSARGTDHNSDNATRWMSMPFMGGAVQNNGQGGKMFGRTRPSDLAAEGTVYSYRTIMKTLMHMLGGDHDDFFPADNPTDILVDGA